MPTICARRYTAGKLVGECEIDDTPHEDLPEGTFDWVGLVEPSAEEMAVIQQRYALHPLAVEDALTSAQSPKVDVYDKLTFIIARTAVFSDEEDESLVFGQTAIFVSCDFIITVRFGSARAHTKLRQKLERDPEHLAQGPDYVAHAVLDFIVDGFGPLVDRVEDLVERYAEITLASFPDPNSIRRLFGLRKQLRRFNYVIGPMEEVCHKLATEDLPAIDDSTHIWFRDVYDHMRRTIAHLQGLGEALANIVETGGLLEQHRQGEITRQLASWAAILAVPTMIAGIYGMNFQFMPELHWRYGYFAAVMLMASVCLTLFFRFRRIGWL